MTGKGRKGFSGLLEVDIEVPDLPRSDSIAPGAGPAGALSEAAANLLDTL
jgi:hypothetical protein